jgi:hypothetical protein
MVAAGDAQKFKAKGLDEAAHNIEANIGVGSRKSLK